MGNFDTSLKDCRERDGLHLDDIIIKKAIIKLYEYFFDRYHPSFETPCISR